MKLGKKEGGFSLVEVMISLVLGLIITISLIEIFISNNQFYRVQHAQARLQENGRYAMQYLTRQIRNVGYKGCATQNEKVSFTNLLDISDNPYLYDFAIEIQGAESTGYGNWNPAINSGSNSAALPKILSGSDVLTLRMVIEPIAPVISHANKAAPLKIEGGYKFDELDSVMVANCQAISIFKNTHSTTSSDGQLSFDVGGSANITGELDRRYIDSEVMKLQTVSYYIRHNAQGVPSLYHRVFRKNSQEIVKGVEQMQLTYGIDTTGDNAINEYQTANLITDWALVKSIQISLVLRTLEDNMTIDGPQNYWLNNTLLTPTDSYLRAVFMQTITLRNRV